MNAMSLKWARYPLAVAAAVLPLAGCGSEAPFGPGEGAAVAALPSVAVAPGTVEPGVCEDIHAPEGSTLAFHAYARGFQVYSWTGTKWQFTGPSATLYADAGGNGVVGSHYGGPTWELNSGALVVAEKNRSCDVDPADIPWLVLNVKRNEGPGVLQGVTHILRVNTAGGQAPAAGGDYVGEIRNVPYTAEYFFYRASMEAIVGAR